MSPLPDPPYTYDDPRITYDEVCFFYDGAGYDAICLAGPTAVVVRKGGGDTGASRRRREAQKKNRLPHLNIFIQSQLLQVNEEIFTEAVKITRFTGEDSPISVFVNRVQLDTRFPYVTGEIKKLVEQKPDLNASVEFLAKIDEKSDDEVIAGNLQTALKDVQVEVVEPYSDIKVEAKLVEEKDMSLSVTLIRKDD